MSNIKQPLWTPDTSVIRDAPVSAFLKILNRKYGLHLQTYGDLHSWSVGVSTSQDFWKEAYNFFSLSAPNEKEYSGPVLESKAGPLFPPPRFFPEANINIAECILRHARDDDVAIHFVREGVDGIAKITWGDLRRRTRIMRAAMVSHGVGVGDVIAAVISNSVEAFVICLAALSLGAIWSSASCELGVESIVDRFSQVTPKLIFADDGYRYNGKLIPLGDRIQAWSHALSSASLDTVIVIPYCNLKVDVRNIHHGEELGHFLKKGRNLDLDFCYLPFNTPAFILYSSGTTGKPKCIVHSAGGVLLKAKIDSILQHDMRETDTVFQYTTTAWVMWVLNFVNLSSARSMLLYDGSPFYPRPTILLELAQELRVTYFGTSPRFLAEIRSRAISPRKQYDLSSLRVMTSTGAVLTADMYDWFYREAFPQSVQLISMSGGTDIAGSFVGGSPLLPVYRGEIQAKALGMDVDIYDAYDTKGSSISSSGKAGELVCVKAFPSQPLRFLGADGMERYRKSYFEKFGINAWCQGDFIQLEADTNGLFMLGRSDGVLNPSGVRFGSAEIYAVTETFEELEDSVCVGQRRQNDMDERVLLMVKLKPGHELSTDLIQKLKQMIRQRYSARHVPKYIFQVEDIPYTINVVSGTVANPQSLAQYHKFADLPAEGRMSSRAASSKL